jgi:hypothetical protein
VTEPRLAPYRVPALAFAAYLLVSAASGAVLFLLKLGPRAQGVAEFYLGSEARFAAPKTLGGILEVALPHLVALPLVLFAASHVVGFARAVSARAFSVLVTVSFGSALAGVAAGFGVRFLAPGLAWVKLGAFVGLELALVGWAALLLALFRPERRAERARRGAAPDVRAGRRAVTDAPDAREAG